MFGVAMITALSAVLAWRLDIVNDVTHFLPRGGDHDDVHLARELAAGELSRTMVLLVDARDATHAAEISRTFEAELRAEPAVAARLARLVAGSKEEFEEAIWATYQPHRTAFAAEDADAARALLTTEALDDSFAELRRDLQTPMSTLLVNVVPADPLRLLPRLFERLMKGRGAGLKLVDGRFVTQAEDGAVLFLTTSTSTTNGAEIRPLLAGIDRAFARVHDKFDEALQLHQSGTHLFATAAEAGIRADIQRVSIGSAIGLTTMFLALFRSLRLLLLVLPILTVGFLAGTCSCLLCFGSVHGLTLAFGAALIGVSVDYGVHFHCHHLNAPRGSPPRTSLRRVWPGLGLGALTTITGFLALTTSSFPGLRQLAVFATFGIAAAALSTWLFLPALASQATGPPAGAAALTRLLRSAWFGPTRSKLTLATPIALTIIVVAVGLPRLRWNDALADLNKVNPELQAEDAAVRARVVKFEQRRLVVATGPDEEAALQTNDQIAKALSQMVEAGALSGFSTIATMLPSAATQAAVDEVIRGDATLAARVDEALRTNDFLPAAFNKWRSFLAEPAPQPLRYSDLADGPLMQMAAPFHFTYSGGVGFVTFLHDLKDEAALRAALLPVNDGRLIDVAGELSGAYGSYRERLLHLWMIGLAMVLALVALRHRALRPTLIAYAPAALGAAGTAATLSLIGLELNMLSLVALLMVVSMGVDYGVFLAEHRGDAGQRDATLLAVSLAGASTIMGFGLLSMSSQPALFHIGLTSAVGVLLCLILAPTICALATPTTSRDAPPH